MKTYHILLGNGDDLLNDFIEALFRGVCECKAVVKCARAGQTCDLVRQACEREFDLVVQIPHNLIPEVSEPTPIGFITEAIRSLQTIKSKRPVPVISIVAPEERSKYEPLLLEAGADCVLELPFDGAQLTSAVGRLLPFPAPPAYVPSKRWFFAGVRCEGCGAWLRPSNSEGWPERALSPPGFSQRVALLRHKTSETDIFLAMK